MVHKYSFELYNTTELSESVLMDFVTYEDYAALQQTLAAARSYVVLDARRGDAHALGLLRAIDKALRND